MHVKSTCTGDLNSRKLLSDQNFCFEIICEIQIDVLKSIFNGQICALICFFFFFLLYPRAITLHSGLHMSHAQS